MLFTKASEYALLSLILIAKSDQSKDVDTISTKLGISKSFLAKILQKLAKDGILKSFKGANGGFSLALEPSEISIKDIIKSAEKKEISVFECSVDQEKCPISQIRDCQIWPMFNAVQNKIDDFLSSISLADIIKKKI